jgi:hypothetical protein
VSVFLTELSSRHSLLTKQKTVQDKPRLKSNSGKLTGWLTNDTSKQPIVVSEDSPDPVILREEDDDFVDLSGFPNAPEEDGHSTFLEASKQRKRGRRNESDSTGQHTPASADVDPSRYSRDSTEGSGDAELPGLSDEKKLRINTSYDGFSIYGRILCLVVKRKDTGGSAGGGGLPASSQKMLENWVSTQAAANQGDDDEEAG